MKNLLLHSFTEEKLTTESTQVDKENFLLKKEFIITAVAGIILGSITGLGIFYLKNSKNKTPLLSQKIKKVKKTAGVKNEKLFPDSTEGILREGGIDGEGSFHLERPGGESQNVYLTSSTIDLTQFIGKKVRVWGKTYKGEKAGWLMDVGYLEVIE